MRATLRPPRRGDVLLARFPFTDLSGTKVRPCLLLTDPTGDDRRLAANEGQSGALTVTACALPPADPKFAQTGLRATSVIHLDKIATLHRQVIPRRLGSIGPRTQQRVAWPPSAPSSTCDYGNLVGPSRTFARCQPSDGVPHDRKLGAMRHCECYDTAAPAGGPPYQPMLDRPATDPRAAQPPRSCA